MQNKDNDIQMKAQHSLYNIDPDKTGPDTADREPAGRKFAGWGVVLVAVAVILSLIGIAALLYLSSPLAPHKLFSAYFEPYPNILTSIGSDAPDLLHQGLLMYEMKDYDSAVVLLNEALPLSDQPSALALYLGNAYLALDKPEVALPYLEAAYGKGDEFAAPARWYTAMALLRQGKIAETVDLLNVLTQQQGYYAEQAGELLDKLP